MWIVRALPVALALSVSSLAIAAGPQPVVRVHSVGPSDIDRQYQAVGDWTLRVLNASNVADAALRDFSKRVGPLAAASNDPARAAAIARSIRALCDEKRAEVLRSQAMLAAIPPFHSTIPALPDVTANSLLVDARAEVNRILQHLDDNRAFADALEKGDEATARQLDVKLLDGMFLMVEGRAASYRDRQIAFPATQSVHQLLGVNAALYRAMGVAGRTWVQARLDSDPTKAAEDEGKSFLSIAADLESLVRVGRANLRRERAEMPRVTNQEERQLAGKINAVFEKEGQIFALGEELEAWLRAHASETGRSLTEAPRPNLLDELDATELRMTDLTRAIPAIQARSER